MNYQQTCIIGTLSEGNIQHNILGILFFCAISRPIARGGLVGLVGSDEPPSQTKGPLFYAKKRSTFYNKRSTFYNTGPLFSIKGPPLIKLVSKRSTIKFHFLKKSTSIYIKAQYTYKIPFPFNRPFPYLYSLSRIALVFSF